MSGSRPPRFAHRAEYALFNAAIRAVSGLSDRGAASFSGRLGRFAYHALRLRRNVVEANLRRAFPAADAAWIRQTAAGAYAHLVREALATIRFTPRGRDAIVANATWEGFEVLHRGLERGRGVVLFGGHLGNWELGAGVIALQAPLDFVVRRLGNPLFDRDVARNRESLGIGLFDRHEATRLTLNALRDNRVVGFLADQDARDAGAFVPFFGTLTSTPRGPALLALRAGAIAAMMVPLRQPDGRLHVRISLLESDREGETDAAVWRLTAAYSQALEQAVRSAPEQYFWHHRRWKTKPPPGETPPAAAG